MLLFAKFFTLFYLFLASNETVELFIFYFFRFATNVKCKKIKHFDEGFVYSNVCQSCLLAALIGLKLQKLAVRSFACSQRNALPNMLSCGVSQYCSSKVSELKWHVALCVNQLRQVNKHEMHFLFATFLISF